MNRYPQVTNRFNFCDCQPFTKVLKPLKTYQSSSKEIAAKTRKTFKKPLPCIKLYLPAIYKSESNYNVKMDEFSENLVPFHFHSVPPGENL